MEIFDLQVTDDDPAPTRFRDLKRVVYIEWLVKRGFWGRDLLTLKAPKQLHHLTPHPEWLAHIHNMNRLFAEKRLVRVPTHLKPFFGPSCSNNEHDLQAQLDAIELGELESPATLKGDDSL